MPAASPPGAVCTVWLWQHAAWKEPPATYTSSCHIQTILPRADCWPAGWEHLCSSLNACTRTQHALHCMVYTPQEVALWLRSGTIAHTHAHTHARSSARARHHPVTIMHWLGQLPACFPTCPQLTRQGKAHSTVLPWPLRQQTHQAQQHRPQHMPASAAGPARPKEARRPHHASAGQNMNPSCCQLVAPT